LEAGFAQFNFISGVNRHNFGSRLNQKRTVMRTSNLNVSPKMNRTSFVDKNKESKKAEIIAWVVFFGIGVAYVVATLILAL
jgi:hypothetical protein